MNIPCTKLNPVFHLWMVSSVRLWSFDAVDSKEMQVNHTEEILCLALTADNRYLITGSKDSSLKMWELENGKLVQVQYHHSDRFTATLLCYYYLFYELFIMQIMVGHTSDVTAVVTAFIANLFSPSISAVSSANTSKHLIVISGSRDQQLIVWDAATGSEIHTFKSHRKAITCLAVSVDGSVLVSGTLLIINYIVTLFTVRNQRHIKPKLLPRMIFALDLIFISVSSRTFLNLAWNPNFCQ